MDGEKEPESVQKNSDWADVTREILVDILSRLTLEERWTGPMMVCKSWLIACKDRSMYSVFDIDSTFESSTESMRWWSSDFERKIDSMFRSVVDWSEGGLTEVRLRHCTDYSLVYAAERCANLEVISVKSCPNVTDTSMAKIAFRCPKLRELDISYCYEVSHESLLIIGRNCPNLKILKRSMMNWIDPSQHTGSVPREYLDACPQDGDSEAISIGKSMPQLRHLEIRFSKLSAKALTLLSEGCQNLEYLDLFGCINLTSRDIVNATSNLKNLKELKKPNFYIPRSVFHAERYSHWNLYDERFQTDVFRI